MHILPLFFLLPAPVALVDVLEYKADAQSGLHSLMQINYLPESPFPPEHNEDSTQALPQLSVIHDVQRYACPASRMRPAS